MLIDARNRFDRKIVAFFSALVRGYVPPHRDADVVELHPFVEPTLSESARHDKRGEK